MPIKQQNSERIEPIIGNSNHEQSAITLIWNVFLEFEGKDYDALGLATFRQFISKENLTSMRHSAHFMMWGYFIDQKLVGIIALKSPCHLTLLFVDKCYQHRGIARRLLQHAIAAFKTTNAVNILTVNASLYAVNVYKKLGFIETDTVKHHQGISFYPMQLKISCY